MLDNQQEPSVIQVQLGPVQRLNEIYKIKNVRSTPINHHDHYSDDRMGMLIQPFSLIDLIFRLSKIYAEIIPCAYYLSGKNIVQNGAMYWNC